MISGREEYMAAQCMLNNGYVLRHYADKYGSGDYEEYEIRFYDEAANPAKYTPASKMEHSRCRHLPEIFLK